MPFRTRTRVVVVVFLTLAAGLVASTGANAQSTPSDRPSEAAGTELVCADEVKSLSARQILDLEDVDTSTETDVRLGQPVSANDAARLDQLQEVRSVVDFGKLRQTITEGVGDNFVSATWSYVNGVEIRVRSGTSREEINKALATTDAPREVALIEIADASLSEPERLRLEDQMATPEILQLFTEVGILAAETDEYCGEISLILDPARSVEEARGKLADVLPVDKLQLRLATDADRGDDAVGRNGLQTTQSGGLRYRVIDGDNGSCTSAAPWYRNVWTPYGYYKEYYAITAGHCVNQSTWSSTPNDWNGAWWTVVTSDANLRQPWTTIATDPASLMYGAELDVAIWRLNSLYQAGEARSATNSDAHGYIWHDLGWWQWDPWNASSTSGGDAVGDWVCQSGYTTSFRAPDPAWNQNVIECGTVTTRNKTWSIGSPETSWFYRLRQTTVNTCGGDSGGTVWRGGWYAGIVKGGVTEINPVNGQTCYDNMVYSHVGWIPYGFNVDAPAEFS